MNTELLKSFFKEEANASVCLDLLDIIGKQKATGLPLIKKVLFNRFNLTIDFEHQQVVLEDDLMVGWQGECKLNLDEFEKTLDGQVQTAFPR